MIGRKVVLKNFFKKMEKSYGIDLNIILNEIYNFYLDFYDEKGGIEINELICFFVGNYFFIL